MTRHCKNCGQLVFRNPEGKHRWLHKNGSKRKCSVFDRPGYGTVAEPQPLTIPSDVTMVVVGTYPVWYRECVFWDRDDEDTEMWCNMKQGVPSKSSTELIEDAERRGLEIYSLGRMEKLS